MFYGTDLIIIGFGCCSTGGWLHSVATTVCGGRLNGFHVYIDRPVAVFVHFGEQIDSNDKCVYMAGANTPNAVSDRATIHVTNVYSNYIFYVNVCV